MKRLFVPGVFDVFHVGHLNYLKHAAEAGDYIVVGVQDDRAVAACKNVSPVIQLADRMAIIESLRFVNEVVSYTEVFQGPLLKGLEIDVFAAGEEYGADDQYPDQKRTLQYCAESGIEVVRIPRTRGISSTHVRSQLRKFWNSRSRLQEELTGGVTVLGSFQGDQGRVDAQTEREVHAILNAVGDCGEKSLLDLGCGDGRQLQCLVPGFRRVVGVDYAESLLEIARKRIESSGSSVVLIEADVSEFFVDEQFDVFLMSGIIPCLDDEQVHQLLGNLKRMSKADSRLLVRSSIGVEKRIDVVNQFSLELQDRYTAYYRTVEEMKSIFAQYGWHDTRDNLLYQHRTDTAVWWFEFEHDVLAGQLPSVKRAA